MARQIGAARLATGHYARIRQNESTGRWELLRARDETKDQSYFLWGLTQEQLSHSEFPLGELTKEEVRAVARRVNLPVAEKPESMELCFVPSGNYVQFIHAYASEQNISRSSTGGDIVTEDGEVLAHHDGVHQFTVGQRKGLGFSTGKALYVLSIDAQTNRVVVGEDQSLRKTTCEIENVNWVSCAYPTAPFRANVKIRHKHESSLATVEPLDATTARVVFDTAATRYHRRPSRRPLRRRSRPRWRLDPLKTLRSSRTDLPSYWASSTQDHYFSRLDQSRGLVPNFQPHLSHRVSSHDGSNVLPAN